MSYIQISEYLKEWFPEKKTSFGPDEQDIKKFKFVSGIKTKKLKRPGQVEAPENESQESTN